MPVLMTTSPGETKSSTGPSITVIHRTCRRSRPARPATSVPSSSGGTARHSLTLRPWDSRGAAPVSGRAMPADDAPLDAVAMRLPERTGGSRVPSPPAGAPNGCRWTHDLVQRPRPFRATSCIAGAAGRCHGDGGPDSEPGDRHAMTHHSQRLWHPFADMARVPGGELVLVRGEGAWLEDEHGRRYLDAAGSLWYCNVGYGRAELADAAAAQMRELAAYS